MFLLHKNHKSEYYEKRFLFSSSSGSRCIGHMKNWLSIFAIVTGLIFPASADLIYPGLDEPPPPPQERVEQIRREFLALKRPLDFTVKVKDGGWRGGDVSELVLGGATARFAKKYSNVELVHALWTILDDPQTEADACMVLYGKIAPKRHGGHFSSYVSPQQPGDWEFERKDNVRFCKSKCRGVVGQGGNPFWKPHPILFQYDYEKFRAMADQPTERAEWIGKLRGWLRDPEVIANNPLEVYKIINTLSLLKANEATPEVAKLLFYSWEQAGNYRYDPEFFREPYNWGSQDDGKDLERAYLMIWPSCPALEFLTRIPRKSALTNILDVYVQSSPEDRKIGIGGGNAPAFVLSFCKGSGLTQNDTIDAIKAYKTSSKDLSPAQRTLLDDLIATIKSGKYQNATSFVDRKWFGKLPFIHQVLSNGDIVGGYRIGDSFFAFEFSGLLGKVDAAWLAAHPDQAKMTEKDMQGVHLDSSREAEYQTFREKTLPLFAGHLVTNAVQLKPRQDRKWYESSH